MMHLSQEVGELSLSPGPQDEVRAFGEVSRFVADGKARAAGFLAAMFSAWAANQFVTFWMDAMGAAMMLGARFLAIVETERGNLRPEMAALSITYAAEFAELLMWSVRQWTELEVAMVAVERVLDYTALPSETWDGRPRIPLPATVQSLETGVPGARFVPGAQPPATWPEHGRLEFQDVWLVYEVRAKGAVKATGGQKVPGRTRDGDGEKPGKAALRGVTFAALAVVPQEPVLFSGSLRSNLDPRGVRLDRETWAALEALALRKTVAAKEKKLEEEAGGALSLGERQLLCVACALLQSATALANLEGEESGGGTPRAFEGAPGGGFYLGTVLYIAHKLSTVLQCDRVIVLDQGRIVEMDSPAVLMAREGSRFAAMVETVG
ncbi:ATP-binding cassette subfamily C (CFTR/MRP) member 1 [Klebsormidium nitens]|uniref:ATP-binding cassette subfamily C (CFTR/MRP) member 1 n=1 Tax=Klebsormidium nitens TaxID=105231 RepID=A0A1Y1ILH0_KLENI|nr:ATP-binding cassette subfamily C (CFTR/MRP) member 1 [Klebsormidium nitens]|eukprot:GAQ91725.1 ATP-binding cassette subfamily C (CFTR/MRP) member 1 [Klebsormidium nitens]